MEKITHKTDNEGNVVIEASGELLSYEAILTPTEKNGRTHIPASAIDTRGIENPQEVRAEIIDSVQRNRGVNGEEPLIVDKSW